MKKFIFTLSAFCFFALTLTAQDVEEVQRSVIFKRTATWCPPCGSWGWNLFESLVEETEGPAILLAAHYSGDLMNTPSLEITNHFGALGQPRFFLNEVDQSASSNNWQTDKEEIRDQVESTFNNINPVANVGINAYYSEDIQEVYLETKTKFFQDAAGKFNLGLYLVENEVINFQASQGNDAVHEKVLRQSLIGNSFGETFFEGSITAGTEFDKTHSFILSDVLNKHYEIVGIIWNQDANGNYIIVNTFMVDQFDQNVSSIAEIPSNLAGMNIMPTVSENSTKVEVILSETFEDMELEIFDVLGRSVLNLSNNYFAKGKHHFDILKDQVGGSGQYFIRMKINDSIKTKSLIFK